MMEKISDYMKVILVGLVSVATVFFLWYQDYTGTANVWFWAFLIGMTIWGAVYSYKRVPLGNLIVMILIAMPVAFLTQFVGTYEGIWDYGAYNPPLYIVTGWVLIALTMLMLTELAYELDFVPAIPKTRYDQYVGVIILVVLFGFLVGTLGNYRPIAGSLFYTYYVALTVFNAGYYFRSPDTKKLLLAIVAAWIAGGFTEKIGESSGMWSFAYGLPVWLVISCWSLEWLFLLTASNVLQRLIQKEAAQ